MTVPEKHVDAPTVGPKESAYTSPGSPAVQVEVDDSMATADYANFCRLSGTPEELLIDVGLDLHSIEITTQPIVLTQRVVLGWHTAKRLLHVLQASVERHEAAFGWLETDVQKRIRRT